MIALGRMLRTNLKSEKLEIRGQHQTVGMKG